MKYTKITKANFDLIAFRVETFIKSHVALQGSGSWGWYPKYLNQLGVVTSTGKNVERTQTNYILSDMTKVRKDKSTKEYWIIINTGSGGCIVFKEGDKIFISSTELKSKVRNELVNKTLSSVYKNCSNIEEAANYYDREKYYEEMYWKDVDEEHCLVDEDELLINKN